MKFRCLLFCLMILSAFSLHAEKRNKISFKDCASPFIMRHGHGEHIAQDRRVSKVSTKPPAHLTNKGIMEIEKAAARAHIEAGIKFEDIADVVSSPLDRTMETAAVFMGELKKISNGERKELLPDRAQYLKQYGEKRGDDGNLTSAPDYSYLASYEEEKRDESKKNSYLLGLLRGTKMKTFPEIQERSFGLCEGKSFAKCRFGPSRDPKQDPKQAEENKKNRESAESDKQIAGRVRKFLKQYQSNYCGHKFKGKVVLVSTHDIVAEIAIKIIEGKERKFATGGFQYLNQEEEFKNPPPTDGSAQCGWTLIGELASQAADAIKLKKSNGAFLLPSDIKEGRPKGLTDPFDGNFDPYRYFSDTDARKYKNGLMALFKFSVGDKIEGSRGRTQMQVFLLFALIKRPITNLPI